MKFVYSYLPILLIFASSFGLNQQVSADQYTILVAPRDSPANEFAESKEDDVNIFSERKFHRALTEAAELLNRSGPQYVYIAVAAGSYTGKANQGVWMLPQITNPEAVLHIVGGFNDDFSARQPFGMLSALQTSAGRNGAFIQIEKKTQLKELVISGFLFDAAPSNSYDTKTNSILKGQSRTYPMISFAQLKTSHLVIDSNIFINGAHGAFDPFISPLGSATVDITNNFFINNIKTMKPATSSSEATINLHGNSFIMNWPYNPDATSSNVSAIELYHSGGAKTVSIRRNIFAFNPGGAMQHDWPENRMPEMVIEENLFYMNAGLFEDGDPEGGVVVGKLGLNPIYLLMDLETLEDDFDYDVDDNVSFDPQIPVAVADLLAADSYSVDRKNTVMNDLRQFFGVNQDGGTVAIANYAPALVFNTSVLPLPRAAEAAGYGVQTDKLWSAR